MESLRTLFDSKNPEDLGGEPGAKRARIDDEGNFFALIPNASASAAATTSTTPLNPVPLAALSMAVSPPPLPLPHNEFLLNAEKRKQQEHLDRKRRNAEQARKSRQRKKNAEALLQVELLALQRENEHLKKVVKSELPDFAQQIISECCYNKGSAQTSGHVQGDASTQLRGSDFELIENLTKTRQSFVLTDPRLPDNPIVYVSSVFLELTGYKREQVIGRNCRFLQGIDTDHGAVATIREAVKNGTDGATILLNYKADGSTFWNHFFVAPLRDKANRVVNFVRIVENMFDPRQRTVC